MSLFFGQAAPTDLPAGDATAPSSTSAPAPFRIELRLRGWGDAESPDPPDAPPPDAPRKRSGDDPDALTLGRLLYGRMDVLLEGAPLRGVLSEFGKTIDVNIVAFYETLARPAPSLAVRADELIDLEMRDVDARTALEAIAALAGPDVTWQLNRGLLEFGPREILARESAQRIRVYEIADLMLSPPYFVPPPGITSSLGFAPTTAGEQTERLRPVDVAADLVRMISEQCEPKAFEPAPEPDPSDEMDTGPRPVQHTAPSGPSSNPRQGVNTAASRNLDPDLGPVFVRGRWATMQVKDTQLVVRAPDFVHRAIGGLPRPIRP